MEFLQEGTVVYAFGYGKHGQLGCNAAVSTEFLSKPTKVTALDGRMVSQVSCGGVFTACLTTFSDVYTWGDIRNGLPSIESHLRGITIIKIVCSAMLTFGLTHTGEVYSWGEVPLSAGENVVKHNNKPTLRSPCVLRGDIHKKIITKIACGALHALFLDSEGKVYSYGSNTLGQLGCLEVSTKEVIQHPKLITVLKDHIVSNIACGGSHSVAISSNTIWVWGSNKFGQLGLEQKYQFVQIPIHLKCDIIDPHLIACGDYHTMVVTSEGEFYSFGQGRCGQLGTGNLENCFTPQLVSTFTKKDKIIKIAAGGGFGCSHCLALTENSILYSWGSGSRGQLGHRDQTDQSLPLPIQFFQDKRILDFSCGWLHSIVLTGYVPERFNSPNIKIENIVDHSLGTFHIVPNDILLIIFMYFRDAKSLLMLGACSKFFYDYTSGDGLWAALSHTHFPSLYGQLTVEKTKGKVIKWNEEYKNLFIEQHGIITDLVRIKQEYHPSNTNKSGWTSLKSFFSRKESRLLMIGLDAPGKTTILYKLKLGEIVTTIPTIGFNVETVAYHNHNFTMWDVGGPDKIRSLWRHYYQNTDGIIFVVDSNDRERMEEAANEFHRVFRDDELQDCVFLIFANKQDLPNAMSPREVALVFGVDAIRKRKVHVQGSVACEGIGLYEGLQWLVEALDN